jgi:hypothetical protein
MTDSSANVNADAEGADVIGAAPAAPAQPNPPPVLVMTLEPDDEEWGARDDRWREDLFDLRTDLEREVAEAVAPEPPKIDAMGVEIVPVIVALAHAGVFHVHGGRPEGLAGEPAETALDHRDLEGGRPARQLRQLAGARRTQAVRAQNIRLTPAAARDPDRT